MNPSAIHPISQFMSSKLNFKQIFNAISAAFTREWAKSHVRWDIWHHHESLRKHVPRASLSKILSLSYRLIANGTKRHLQNEDEHYKKALLEFRRALQMAKPHVTDPSSVLDGEQIDRLIFRDNEGLRGNLIYNLSTFQIKIPWASSPVESIMGQLKNVHGVKRLRTVLLPQRMLEIMDSSAKSVQAIFDGSLVLGTPHAAAQSRRMMRALTSSSTWWEKKPTEDKNETVVEDEAKKKATIAAALDNLNGFIQKYDQMTRGG